MAKVHKLLTGDGAGTYLPFALSRLRYLRKHTAAGAWRVQQFQTDNAQIKVTKGGRHEDWVKITAGGGVYFEFFTSGKPAQSVTITDPVQGSLTSYLTATVGTPVTVSNGAVSVKPQILTGTRKVFTQDASALGQVAQVNLINEPHSLLSSGTSAKLNQKYPNLLYRSWAPQTSISGIFLRCYNRNLPGFFSSNMERDVLYDVPWSETRGVTKMRSAYLFGDADWPRCSGYQTVQDPIWGNRSFAIYVDAFSQIWVFPVADVPPPGAGYATPDPVSDVQGMKVTFPEWAYVPTQTYASYFAENIGQPDQAGLTAFPQIDWQMHPDGTKICAVVWQRNTVAYDSAFFAGLPSPTGSPATDYAGVQAGCGYDRSNGFEYAPGVNETLYQLSPGLIESTINISITGSDPGAFTISGETSEIRTPGSTEFATMTAGYAWHDIPAPYTDSVGAARGDLCVMDLEVYYTPDANPPSYGTVYAVKNATQGYLDICPGSSSWWDMTTLSFCGVSRTQVHGTSTLSLRPNYPPNDGTWVTGGPPGSSGTGTDGHTHRVLPSTWNVPSVTSWPCLTMTTLGVTRAVVPDPGMPADLVPSAAGTSTPATRTSLSEGGFEFVPANLADTWASHSNLRNWLAWQAGYTPGPYTLSTQDAAFYDVVMGGYDDLLYIQTPNFGTNLYETFMILNMGRQPRLAAFAHPNGSWGAFNVNEINDQNPWQVALTYYDTYTPYDTSLLSVSVLDRIHLELPGAIPLDTSFIEMYNQALTNSTGKNTITDTFYPLTTADFSPTFSGTPYVYTIVPGGIGDGDSSGLDVGKQVQWLQLGATYPNGDTYYTFSTATITGSSPLQDGVPYGSENTNDFSVFGSSTDATLLLDAVWYTEPNYSGFIDPPTVDWGRCAFATPTLVVS